jgi:hypothetical protein
VDAYWLGGQQYLCVPERRMDAYGGYAGEVKSQEIRTPHADHIQRHGYPREPRLPPPPDLRYIRLNRLAHPPLPIYHRDID